jgi:hypothetical protein
MWGRELKMDNVKETQIVRVPKRMQYRRRWLLNYKIYVTSVWTCVVVNLASLMCLLIVKVCVSSVQMRVLPTYTDRQKSDPSYTHKYVAYSGGSWPAQQIGARTNSAQFQFFKDEEDNFLSLFKCSHFNTLLLCYIIFPPTLFGGFRFILSYQKHFKQTGYALCDLRLNILFFLCRNAMPLESVEGSGPIRSICAL